MVLQAFEYEKRDKCPQKHQEFFDSTEGKFNHPFVVGIVEEINSQRATVAAAAAKSDGMIEVAADDDETASTSKKATSS